MQAKDLAQNLDAAATAVPPEGKVAPGDVVKVVRAFLESAAVAAPKASKLDEVAEMLIAAWKTDSP